MPPRSTTKRRPAGGGGGSKRNVMIIGAIVVFGGVAGLYASLLMRPPSGAPKAPARAADASAAPGLLKDVLAEGEE